MIHHRGAEDGEERLLLSCARRAPVVELAGQDTDWERVLRLAARHGLSALVYVHLKEVEGIPAELRERALAAALQDLRMIREVIRVMEHLRASGIQALPFKGAVLAARLYGEAALREYSDLDILIRKQDLQKAVAGLGDLGYLCSEVGFETGNHTRMLVRKQSGTVIDLHWGLMHERFVREGDWEQVWDRLGSVSLGGREMPTLGDEDLLHYLCIHGSKHLWSSLGWLCDVAGLLRAGPEIDWKALVERARRSGTRRMLLLGLLLANELLEASVPSWVLEEAAKDASVRRLTAEVSERMFDDDRHAGPFGVALFRLRVSERWRDRVRHVVMIAVSPNSVLHGMRWLGSRA